MSWSALLLSLWQPLLAILGVVLAFLAGWRGASQRAAQSDLETYKSTRERIDDAESFGNDPDAARRWLRERDL